MPEIKNLNKKIKIDKIISFGCSYTAGDELLDETIHPDADEIKRSKGMEYWNKTYSQNDIFMKTKEQQLAWPGQVAKILDVDFVGKARCGGSMMGALYDLEKSIIEEEVTKSTLILFGTTTKERFLFFDKNRTSPKNILLAGIDAWPARKWNPHTVIDIFNDGFLLWNHLLCLSRLLEISDRLEGRLQIFEMDKHVNVDDYTANLAQDVMQVLRHRYNEIYTHSNLHFKTTLLSLCKSKKDQHGGNHPKIHIHEEFAKYVIEAIT